MSRPTTTEGSEMKNYRRATKRVDVSIGDSVRVLRELQELSQNDLAQLTGIPQSTISAIERDRVNLGRYALRGFPFNSYAVMTNTLSGLGSGT